MQSLRIAAREWLNAVLSFLYPECCQLCRTARATPAQSFVCAGCRREVRFIESPFCRRCGRPYEGEIDHPFECSNCRGIELHFCWARSAVYAQGPVLEVIHRYKYNRALWFEPLLCAWLVDQAVPVLAQEKWDWLVPVPLHSAKQRQREFNQAVRLARGLSKAAGIPVHHGLLERRTFTQSQTLLSREQRQANVRGAFAVKKRQRLDGKRLVLVDDVFTTGATSSACAKVLRNCGADDVCVWTVARGV